MLAFARRGQKTLKQLLDHSANYDLVLEAIGEIIMEQLSDLLPPANPYNAHIDHCIEGLMITITSLSTTEISNPRSIKNYLITWAKAYPLTECPIRMAQHWMLGLPTKLEPLTPSLLGNIKCIITFLSQYQRLWQRFTLVPPTPEVCQDLGTGLQQICQKCFKQENPDPLLKSLQQAVIECLELDAKVFASSYRGLFWSQKPPNTSAQRCKLSNHQIQNPPKAETPFN
jgi:hypothetical protein